MQQQRVELHNGTFKHARSRYLPRQVDHWGHLKYSRASSALFRLRCRRKRLRFLKSWGAVSRVVDSGNALLLGAPGARIRDLLNPVIASREAIQFYFQKPGVVELAWSHWSSLCSALCRCVHWVLTDLLAFWQGTSCKGTTRNKFHMWINFYTIL